jgi:hypothetical protein
MRPRCFSTNGMLSSKQGRQHDVGRHGEAGLSTHLTWMCTLLQWRLPARLWHKPESNDLQHHTHTCTVPPYQHRVYDY